MNKTFYFQKKNSIFLLIKCEELWSSHLVSKKCVLEDIINPWLITVLNWWCFEQQGLEHLCWNYHYLGEAVWRWPTSVSRKVEMQVNLLWFYICVTCSWVFFRNLHFCCRCMCDRKIIFWNIQPFSLKWRGHRWTLYQEVHIVKYLFYYTEFWRYWQTGHWTLNFKSTNITYNKNPYTCIYAQYSRGSDKKEYLMGIRDLNSPFH